VQEFAGHDRHVGAVALSPDAKLALTAEFALIRVWDVESGKELRRFELHTGEVQEMVFSPDGKRALSVSRDGTARVWEVDTAAEVRCFAGHQGQVWGAAFLMNGKQALTGDHNGVLCRWDVETGEEIRRWKDVAGVGCIALSPDGKQALSCGGNELVRLWDLAAGEQRLSLKQPQGARRVAFSPDGKQALAGSHHTGQAILWDLETGKEIQRFRAGPPNGVIYGVAFTPDGRYAVTGSSAARPMGTVRLWEVATGKELARIEEDGAFYALAVSQDGKLLLTTGAASGVPKLYRLPPAVWPAAARR
jgi:WD40 repeat protein